MAKSTRSLHIEDRLWDDIDDVQSKFNTSRSSALEYILIERRTLLNMLDVQKSNRTLEISENKKNISTNVIDKKIVEEFGNNDIMPE